MNIRIVHISGVSGSGKSTLGRRLRRHLRNRAIVKDLDDLRDEFIRIRYGDIPWTFLDPTEYQTFIQDFIHRQTKPIIFVGLHDNRYGRKKRHYYDLGARYKYFIETDDTTLLRQKCARLLKDTLNNERAMRDLVQKNKTFVTTFLDAFHQACDARAMSRMNRAWRDDHRRQGYHFLSPSQIFQSIISLFDKKKDMY